MNYNFIKVYIGHGLDRSVLIDIFREKIIFTRGMKCNMDLSKPNHWKYILETYYWMSEMCVSEVSGVHVYCWWYPNMELTIMDAPMRNLQIRVYVRGWGVWWEAAVGIADVTLNLRIPWLFFLWKFTLSDVPCRPSYKRALLGPPRKLARRESSRMDWISG